MSQNPNYENDPCYIEWKAYQDAKDTEISTQRELIGKGTARKIMEYDERESENEQRYMPIKLV